MTSPAATRVQVAAGSKRRDGRRPGPGSSGPTRRSCGPGRRRTGSGRRSRGPGPTGRTSSARMRPSTFVRPWTAAIAAGGASCRTLAAGPDAEGGRDRGQVGRRDDDAGEARVLPGSAGAARPSRSSARSTSSRRSARSESRRPRRAASPEPTGPGRGSCPAPPAPVTRPRPEPGTRTGRLTAEMANGGRPAGSGPGRSPRRRP